MVNNSAIQNISLKTYSDRCANVLQSRSYHRHSPSWRWIHLRYCCWLHLHWTHVLQKIELVDMYLPTRFVTIWYDEILSDLLLSCLNLVWLAWPGLTSYKQSPPSPPPPHPVWPSVSPGHGGELGSCFMSATGKIKLSQFSKIFCNDINLLLRGLLVVLDLGVRWAEWR